ncbi:D-alanyl-D-alanine carboxypeptidase [candidate division WWE3 bacterium]|nr:D-alanyl-D-alanine carboxypeptidase [candidate division WWE3 bacterium]
MKLSMSQKLKIGTILGAAYAIYVFDILRGLPERLVHAGARTVLYVMIVVFAFTAFLVESSKFELGVESVFGSMLNSSPKVLGAFSAPRLVRQIPQPAMTSVSVYAIDVKSKRVLLAISENEKHPPASTTKLMTALVAYDTYSLDDALVVPVGCTDTESQEIDLLAGEEILVEDLLRSLLIGSAGDAACALAFGKGNYGKFIEKMNVKAAELGMENTRFSNPIGLDGANGDHVTTARDLSVLSVAAIQNSFFKDTVGLKEYVLKSGSLRRTVTNTNDLLWNYPGTVGIKTGRTYAAGEVLAYQYADDKKSVIIVVMGSNDRFTDTKKILQWILDSYHWD